MTLVKILHKKALSVQVFSTFFRKDLMMKYMRFLIFTLLLLPTVVMAGEFDYYTTSICPQTAALAKQARYTKVGAPFVADFLVVDKARKIMHVMSGGKVYRTFKVALGKKDGKKRQEGDKKTPEGLYYIGYKNSASDFHLSLEITYPNADDVEWARKRGVSAGGDIMVHGLPNEWWKRTFINHPKSNWTRGCVAVNNQEIEEIWGYVKTATPIELCK